MQPKKNNKKNRTNDKPDRRPNRGYKGPEEEFETRGSNDISWYMHDASLVEAAGRLNFNNPLGTKIPNRLDLPAQGNLFAGDSAYSLVGTTNAGSSAAVGGLCLLMCSPYYGVSDSAYSPINVAARAAFGRMRSTLSTSNLGFDASDLMAYFIAVDNLFSYYAWMTRVYGLASTANVLNRYEGRRMVLSNGVDYDDVVEHYSDLRYYTRVFAKKVNAAIRMPKGYGITERHFWLFSNVFKDGATSKSQYYMHVPTGFYRWSSRMGSGGSGAEYLALQSPFAITASAYEKGAADGVAPLKVSDIIEFGNLLLDALLVEDDVALISGMVLRTYGTEGSYVLNDMNDDYSVVPVYNEEILEQIHNTTFVGCSPSQGNWKGEHYHDEEFYTLYPNGGDEDELHYIQTNRGNTDTYLISTPRWATLYLPTDSDVPERNMACHINAMAVGGASTPTIDSRKEVPDAATVMIDSRNILSTNATIDFNGAVTNVALKSAGLEIYYFGLIVGVPAGNPTIMALFATNAFGSSVGFVSTKAEFGTDTPTGYEQAFLFGYLASTPNISALANFDWAPRVQCIATNLISSDERVVVDIMSLGDIWEYNNYTFFNRDTLDKLHEAALMGAFAMPIQTKAWKA